MTFVTMFSHALRMDERDVTLAAFERVNVPVDHVTVQTTAPSKTRNRLNALTALDAAPDNANVLLIEDDVTPSSTLRAWLHFLECEYANSPVTLFAAARHFYPRDALTQRHSRVETLENLHAWYGSQAVWMPAHVAHNVRQDEGMRDPADSRPFDRAFRQHLATHKQPLLVTLPNLVEHRAPPHLVSGTRIRPTSPMFIDGAPTP